MSLDTTHDGTTPGTDGTTPGTPTVNPPAAARGPVSRWARDVAGPAPEPTVPTQPVAREGVRGLAAAMVAGPLAMTAWFLVEPAVLPREEPEVFLASVAAAPERYMLATVFVVLAGALAIPAALGVGRLLRPRMPRLAALLVVVMSLSGLGLWAQAGFRSFVVSMVRDGSVPASAVESYTAFQENGLFDALLLPALALGALSTLVWVGALVRTRLAPFWVPAALLVGAVLASGEFPDAVTVGGAAVVAAGNVALARILLRGARA
jgi:hypothetical protein